MCRYLLLALSCILFFYSGTANAVGKVATNQFKLHGLSQFAQTEKIELRKWVSQGVNATRATLGIYPQILELYLYPKKSNQPVPWAHTRRDEHTSVHLYVDSRFPLDKFVNDWTIYHEIAHLAIPYLGAEYRWFSEGFASFMQYQIMDQSGVLKSNLAENYKTKIAPHLRWFNSDLTAASIATRLMNNKQYPAAYWGSAYFFVLADKTLQAKKGIPLSSLISAYQDCCRSQDQNIEQLLTSLDKMIDDKLFTQLMDKYQTLPARKLYPEFFGQ